MFNLIYKWLLFISLKGIFLILLLQKSVINNFQHTKISLRFFSFSTFHFNKPIFFTIFVSFCLRTVWWVEIDFRSN